MEKITIGELERWARPIGYAVNDIIDWINERDEELKEEWDLMTKWVDKVNKWIEEHEKHSPKGDEK